MKEWIFPILITTVASLLIRVLLPREEKSPLYPTLKFLLSLALTLSVLSPFISFSEEVPKSTLPSLSFSETYEGNGQERILETCKKDIENAVRITFPEDRITLELKTGNDSIPTGIHFVCENEESGEKIAAFLQKNFSLITTYDIKGDTA